MTAKQFLKSIFLAKSGSISSKRICGVLGWLICLIVLIYCTIVNTQAPEMVETVLIMSATLLGVDSVTNIWKGKKHG